MPGWHHRRQVAAFKGHFIQGTRHRGSAAADVRAHDGQALAAGPGCVAGTSRSTEAPHQVAQCIVERSDLATRRRWVWLRYVRARRSIGSRLSLA